MHVRTALQVARRATPAPVRAAPVTGTTPARRTLSSITNLNFTRGHKHKHKHNLLNSTDSHVVARYFSSTPCLPSTPMAAETDTAASLEAASSGITPDTLTAKLQSSLNTTYISIEDMSGGCGQAFAAVIVSPEFEKKTLLARHRLVNGVLKEEIKAIHAWTPRCLTPEQWSKERERIGES